MLTINNFILLRFNYYVYFIFYSLRFEFLRSRRLMIVCMPLFVAFFFYLLLYIPAFVGRPAFMIMYLKSLYNSLIMH